MKWISLAFLMFAATAMAQDAGGFWKGAIQVQGQSLEIIIDLTYAEDEWKGTIDIPLQGLKGFALSNIKAMGDSIEFKMAGVPGDPHFEGKLVDAGSRIEGDFHQNGATFQFELARGDKAAYQAKSKRDPIKPIAGSGPLGTFAGDLKTGPADLRLVFEIGGATDALTVVLNSVDQGVKLTADQADFKDGTITIGFAQIQGQFEGKLNQDGSAFEGNWSQAGQQLPLTIFRTK